LRRNEEKIMAEETKVSKAQQKAVNKYVKNNYDRINVTFPKGEKEKIRAHAQSGGESVNAFIIRAVRETMERESMGIPFPDIIREDVLNVIEEKEPIQEPLQEPEVVLETPPEVKIEPESVQETLPEVEIEPEPVQEALPEVELEAFWKAAQEKEEEKNSNEPVFVPMNQEYKELLKAEYGYSNEEMEELMQPVIEKKSATPVSSVAIDPIWTQTVFPDAAFSKEERLDGVFFSNTRQEEKEEGGESLENMIERLCREHMMTAKKLKK
jgi:hypothetical protein